MGWLMYPHGEQVTILHPGTPTEDPDYGTPAPGEPTPEVVDRAAVAPGVSGENLDQQATVDVAYTVYVPAGYTVEPEAQMIVRGLTCEVVGLPREWSNPFTGWEPGTEVYLRRSQ